MHGIVEGDAGKLEMGGAGAIILARSEADNLGVEKKSDRQVVEVYSASAVREPHQSEVLCRDSQPQEGQPTTDPCRVIPIFRTMTGRSGTGKLLWVVVAAAIQRGEFRSRRPGGFLVAPGRATKNVRGMRRCRTRL